MGFDIWKDIIQEPLINVLIVIADFLGDNFGLAIIALTILINLAMLPLTLSQVRSSKAMQDLQPKMAELQKKYAKDKERLAREQMALYKESGIKPAGCMLTFVIQMPIWVALYQAVLLTLAAAPEGLLNLSRYLYNWDIIFNAMPLDPHFLGLNLGSSAMPGSLILALFVGGTMWVQQKMSATEPTNPQQASQTQMMQWMMPMMFAVITLSVPSGLALYWACNSLVRIGIQAKISGWGGLKKKDKSKQAAPGEKYLKFDTPEEKKSTVDSGADIVISDEPPTGKPAKPRKNQYQPGKQRQQHKKKKD